MSQNNLNSEMIKKEYASQLSLIDSELSELELALNELKDCDESYILMHSVMVKKTSEEIKQKLLKKKELLELQKEHIKSKLKI
jgi:chaperonin cofactor prefoldin